jgi:ubiquinone biosynthesis protein COQ9
MATIEETKEEILIHLPKKAYSRDLVDKILEKIELERAIEVIDFDDSIFDLVKKMKSAAWQRLKPMVLKGAE